MHSDVSLDQNPEKAMEWLTAGPINEPQMETLFLHPGVCCSGERLEKEAVRVSCDEF